MLFTYCVTPTKKRCELRIKMAGSDLNWRGFELGFELTRIWIDVFELTRIWIDGFELTDLNWRDTLFIIKAIRGYRVKFKCWSYFIVFYLLFLLLISKILKFRVLFDLWPLKVWGSHATIIGVLLLKANYCNFSFIPLKFHIEQDFFAAIVLFRKKKSVKKHNLR